MLEQIETVAGLRARLSQLASPKPDGRSRGLVPTMGALHAGHAELIKTARRECGVVVVSIFVNPLQFNNPDDLATYPRTIDEDVALCRELGVDIVFRPSAPEVYPTPPECTIDIGRLGDHLCGRFRPGHFRGVATIVMKLFHMVQPERAYFGEKDAQQLAIIRRLAGDFDVPVTIVEVPTVREADGLALSSRNRHLTSEQRARAVCLHRALLEAERLIASGEPNAATVTRMASALVHSEGVKLEYLDVVDPMTMQPVVRIEGDVRVAGAIWVGRTRLIDNLLVRR